MCEIVRKDRSLNNLHINVPERSRYWKSTLSRSFPLSPRLYFLWDNWWYADDDNETTHDTMMIGWCWHNKYGKIVKNWCYRVMLTKFANSFEGWSHGSNRKRLPHRLCCHWKVLKIWRRTNSRSSWNKPSFCFFLFRSNHLLKSWQ